MRAPTSRRRPAVCAVLAVIARARAAHADSPPHAVLAWVRAEGAEACPDGAAIAQQVTARLGRDPFAATAAQHVEVVVARDGTHWTARIFVRDGVGAVVGARQLAGDAPDCGPIATAAIVAVAVGIDPEAAFAPPAAAPPHATSPPRSPPLPPSPARMTLRPTPRTSTLRPARGVSAFARGYGAFGLLPALAPGAGLAVDPWVSGRFRVAVTALFLGEQATVSPRVGLGLSAGSVGACIEVVTTRTVALAGCGAVWLGATYAVVYQLTPLEPGPRPWVAGSLGARLTVRLVGALSAELALDAVTPFTDYQYYVAGSSTTLFQAARVSAVGAAGLGVRFW